MGAEEFETEVRRLITQVGHWGAARWHAPADPAGASRGDVVFALVQRLADLGADAERRRHRPVPRLADTVLPDQLRVTAADLLAAAPPGEALESATAAISAVREVL